MVIAIDGTLLGLAYVKGSRSPDPKPRSLGLYPLQNVRSTAVDHDSVSRSCSARSPPFFFSSFLHPAPPLIIYFLIFNFCLYYFTLICVIYYFTSCTASCCVSVMYSFHLSVALWLIFELCCVVADSVVLATGAHHHVPAGTAVHDRRARLQHDHLLRPRRAPRTHHPHRQMHHWRGNPINRSLLMMQFQLTFTESLVN